MSEDMRKPVCKRCGRETEPNEIHLFRGGEDRRQTVEEEYKTKVTLCTNPPSESFWRHEKEWYERDDITDMRPLTMAEADSMFEKWLIENMKEK